MGGGLMQLVAYGAQDVYLTGNPQITFFKVVYRRHTNFAMEAIEQTFSGNAAYGSTATATLARNGDLLSRLYLQVDLTGTGAAVGTAGTYVNWVNNTGHALLKEAELEIGGQTIDKHYSVWMDCWNELNDATGEEHALLNKHSAKNAYLRANQLGSNTTNATRLYIPLQFWFCRNPGLALPLIALQYHEVKLRCVFRSAAALINADVAAPTVPTAAATIKLYADYVYLDTDERRRFAQVSHEYLIEQVQFTGSSTLKASNTLNFNHPVKELVWVCVDDDANTESTTGAADATLNVPGTIAVNNDYFNYQSNATTNSEVINGVTCYEPFSTAKLQLNGHDRFAARNASYFRTCQPLQHHGLVPSKHVYSYSFALKPSEHQPSGTCNFSRIDNASLKFESVLSTTQLYVFAHGYNVLRVMRGMGGLAYSN